MDIFESLENLNVSEECFDDIVGLVEEILNENTEYYAQNKADQLSAKRNDAWRRIFHSGKYKPETVERHKEAYNKADKNISNKIEKLEGLSHKARKVREKGIEATTKKEQKRIENNETRTDIHPSVLNSVKKREESLKKVAGQEDSIGRTNWSYCIIISITGANIG